MIEGAAAIMTEQVSMFDLTLRQGDKARVELYSDEVQYAPPHYFEECEVKVESIDWCTVQFATGEMEKIDAGKLIRI